MSFFSVSPKKKPKASKGKSSKQNRKDKAPKKSSPNFDLEHHLQLYSDSDDLPDDLEDFFSHPKKRCLRSSSTEDKERASPFNLCLIPGPSSTQKLPDTSVTVPSKKTEVTNSKFNSKKGPTKSSSKTNNKSEKKSKGKETASLGGKSRSRKTGSCASNR